MAYNRRDYAGAAAATTLTSGINSSDTTLSIAAYAGWPTGANGPFAVVINAGTASEEKVLCTSRSNGTITVSQRAYDGTTASAHLSGATIKHCITAVDFDEANYWVAELATAAAAANDLIIADSNDSLSKISKGSNSTVLAVDSGGTLGYTTVTSAMITDGTIVAGDLASNAVTTAKITDANVTTAKIADGAVTTDKVADAAVTSAKIAAAVAGNGLTGGAGSALAVNVDDSTLEIASDIVRVKDSGITVAKLAAAVQALLLPAGLIAPYGASTAPTGWLLCDGSAVSRTTYAALFAVLSTEFGAGNGTTTFNVPDLRGRAPIGLDNLGGTAASRITSAVAGLDGTDLGAAGGDQRQHAHTHTGPSHTHTGPSHQHTPNAIASFITTDHGAGDVYTIAAGTDIAFRNVTQTSAAGTGATGSSGTGATGSTGGGNTQNVQPSIVVGYIIKT